MVSTNMFELLTNANFCQTRIEKSKSSNEEIIFTTNRATKRRRHVHGIRLLRPHRQADVQRLSVTPVQK